MCRLTGGRVARVTGERSLRWLEHGWPSSTPAVGPGKPSRWASIAKSHAADAYVAVADSGIRVHGGIGFTWEHDMHLYLRRAKLNQALFGSSLWHRERLAEMLVAERSGRDYGS